MLLDRHYENHSWNRGRQCGEGRSWSTLIGQTLCSSVGQVNCDWLLLQWWDHWLCWTMLPVQIVLSNQGTILLGLTCRNMFMSQIGIAQSHQNHFATYFLTPGDIIFQFHYEAFLIWLVHVEASTCIHGLLGLELLFAVLTCFALSVQCRLRCVWTFLQHAIVDICLCCLFLSVGFCTVQTLCSSLLMPWMLIGFLDSSILLSSA